MPLSMVNAGECRIVQDFQGDDQLKARLRDMGFFPGEPVLVIGENPSGLILEVKGVRLALNRGLAHKISVA